MSTAVAEFTGFGMNTVLKHSIYGKNAQAASAAVQGELARLENKLSRFVAGSEISRINRAAGKTLVQVSSEIYQVLLDAIRFCEVSQGLFDISIAPLVDLWNYQHAHHAPQQKKIKQALALIGYRDLVLKPDESTAGLRYAGQCIDLGGVGKGVAGDCCIGILRDYDIHAAYIDIGASVSVLGSKPNGSPWRVGIRHPRQEGQLLGVVDAVDKAVVTSGDYERYFVDKKGKRWHHILNPTTGYPAEAGLISVTVVADTAIKADALSTAIFVAGEERGLEYLSHFPGSDAVLMDDLQRVFVTQGLQASYKNAEGVMAHII